MHTPYIEPALIPNDIQQHQYSIKSAAEYANTVAQLIRNRDLGINREGQYINHILHHKKGRKCGYNQLVNNKIPGQSPAKWRISFANKLGRLANDVGDKIKECTNTVVFISR